MPEQPAETTTVSVIAEQSENLDTLCFRGSASLADLTRVSQADVFDQETNAEGLQRDFSKRHALDAYEYVARPPIKAFPRAFPEVVLNVRDRKVVRIEDLAPSPDAPEHKLVRVTFDVDAIQRARNIKVSRVDGNHRLMFGAGDGDKRAELVARVPFQLHVGLTREQEASVFLDINAEQKGLNTSHLAYLRSRMTPEDVELERHPQRVFAKRLISDESSPWHGLVFLGGSKAGLKAKGQKLPVTFKALEEACRRMLTRSHTLQHELTSPDAQYALLRSYWRAVALTWPEAWDKPEDWYVLKNIGVTVLATLGAQVIDRAMSTGDVEVHDLAEQLAAVKDRYDWRADAPNGNGLVGMSGNAAVTAVVGELTKKLPKLSGRRGQRKDTEVDAPAEREEVPTPA